MIAASFTLIITVALTVYALTTKTDFTYLGGGLFMAFFLISFSFIFIFWINYQVM